jgi:pyrroline-5-carboxylate reductase
MVSIAWRRIVMSTLEKTIDILNVLPEKQIEIVYSYVQFIHSQQMEREQSDSVNDILDNLAGALPDSGKTLEQYHEERIRERYEVAD